MSTSNSPASPKRFHALAYGTLFLVIAALGVNQARLQGAQNDDTSSVVAKVDGQPISMQELLDRAAPTLDQVEGQRLACVSTAKEQRHQVLSNTVEVMVRERLSSNAAEKAGVAKDQWLSAEKQRQVAAVTTDQVDLFYEERAAQLRQPKEQLEERIREYLAVEKMYADLKEASEIDVTLAPYRLEIETKNSPG